MRYTAKYNFNLIDTSDAFGPEALNANTQAVEDKLAALANADAADKTALEQALAALKSELTAADAADKAALEKALAAQKSELSATHAADKAALQAADAALRTAIGSGGRTCRITTGSYVGSNDGRPKSITVDFKPRVVYVAPETGSYGLLMLWPCGNAMNLSTSTAVITATWEDRKVTWNSYMNSSAMLNLEGIAYHYIVIGESA